jgi:hypothetical protein
MEGCRFADGYFCVFAFFCMNLRAAFQKTVETGWNNGIICLYMQRRRAEHAKMQKVDYTGQL